MLVAGHPDPLAYVLTSEEWRKSLGFWTIAPLYYLFAAVVLKVSGGSLLALRLTQYVVDAVAAVLVGLLGRQASGRRGHWAGVAYALCWPFLELTHSTMTENAHTPLLLAAFATLIGAVGRSSSRPAVAALAGFLLGLSVLARSVGLLFAPLAALLPIRELGWRKGRLPAALFLAGTAAAVLPWTARNVFVIGDPSPVESLSIFNFWTDNAFVNENRLAVQAARIAAEPTPAARRALAMEFAWRGIRREPGAFLQKSYDNLRHFVRPEGLHYLLLVEEPRPLWRHLVEIGLGDLWLVLALVLFPVFLLAGPRSPARTLFAWWTVYYVGMVVVVFHNDVRYRSALLPFALAALVGGGDALRRGAGRRSAVAGLALGGALVVWRFWPYGSPALAGARAWWAQRPVAQALAEGRLSEAEATVREAARRAPVSARPWLRYGRLLHHAGRPAEAARAYRRAAEVRADHWTPIVVLPRILSEAGESAAAEAALARAHRFSKQVDPWLALETAWRELAAPQGAVLALGEADYGAVRGLLEPQGHYRWSLRRAWLRLRPPPAPAYDVTLEMSSPEPSPFAQPEVEVRVEGGSSARFVLARAPRLFTLRTGAPPSGVLMVRVSSPVWSQAFLAAEQGVRVHGLTVAPAAVVQSRAPRHADH
ncbi:MAG TPA: hypothetical protein VII13_17060 [Vicinamibacteria bacterium]|jgi:4-amino-4-deoxy-L-arabinose transferase-like glycosyltransferase